MNSPLANNLRWLIALLIVIGLHIALAVALMLGWNPLPPTSPMPAAAVMLELSPLTEAPNNPSDEDPAPIDQQVSDPTPVEPEPIKEPDPIPVQETIEAPKPKVIIPPKEKPKPIKKPVKKPVEKPIEKPKEVTEDTLPKAEATTKASTTSEVTSDRVAAPSSSSSNKPSKAQVTWQSRLLGHLKRYQRYPNEARYKRQEDIVKVFFTINSEGYVVNSRIVSSSGYSALDRETIALLKRAEPLPKPPAEILKGKTSISLVVPIEFNLKKGR